MMRGSHMRLRTRTVLTACGALAIVGLVATPGFGYASTGWQSNSGHNNLDWCYIQRVLATNGVGAAEMGACSRDVGVDGRYYRYSTPYQTGIAWASGHATQGTSSSSVEFYSIGVHPGDY